MISLFVCLGIIGCLLLIIGLYEISPLNTYFMRKRLEEQKRIKDLENELNK